MSRRSYVLGLVAIFAAAAVIGLLRPDVVQSEGRTLFDESVVRDVRDRIAQNYVETSPDLDKKLYYGALQGMTDVLDPHSVFLPPKDREELKIDTQGKFGGLGILIEKPLGRNGPIVIVTPFIGTPASKAGIQPGDRIVEIEGKSTFGMRLTEAVDLLRGEPGTQVNIKIQHGGRLDSRAYRAGRLLAGSRLVSVDGQPVEGLKESEIVNMLGEKRGRNVEVVVVPEVLAEAEGVKLERAIISVPNVEYVRMVDDEAKIGYVHVARFQEDTADSIRDAIEELRAKGMRALVLDLRWNGGGLLGAAIKVAKLFLDKGQVVVSTRPRGAKGREGPKHEYKARFNPPYPKSELPMAVLVNGSSASASEILAAAVNDPANRRGVVVGERTFGKASVQELYDVNLGRDLETRERLIGWLKLTTQKYYTPSGVSIQRDYSRGAETEEEKETWGVEPDFPVVMSDDQVRDLRRQWEKDRIDQQRVGAGSAPEAHGERAPDPQLERAVDLLRAALLFSASGEFPVVPVETEDAAPEEMPVPAP